jgi:hypothetical protein
MYLYRSATVDRMWEILEADSPFSLAIATARRIKPDNVGWLKRIMLKAPADFPHVWLALGNNSQVRPFPTGTFAEEPAQFSTADDWQPTAAADFTLRVTYRDEQQATNDFRDDIESKAIAALTSAGPVLNNASGTALSRASGVGLIRSIHTTALVSGVVRPVTTMTIPVSYDLFGSDLLPD